MATTILAIAGEDVSVVLVPEILGFALMGCVLLARRPGHPMGPLLALFGLADAISAVPFAYERYALLRTPGSLPFTTTVLWLNTWSYMPALALAGLVLPLVFPEGRVLSRRWLPALWAALAFIPLSIAGNAFIAQDMGGYFHHLPNPYVIGSADRLFEALQVLAWACALAAAVAATASIVQRWRRAGRVGRQQLKWFLAIMPFAAVPLIIDPVNPDLLSLAAGAFAGALLPMAIGVAVLRYRLYEIDILLNRAALYASLSAVVAGVFLAVVGAARWLFGTNRDLAVQVLATVLAAAALWPMRDRVQRRLERLFYGDRGAPYEALARLGRRVEEAIDAESALDSVVQAIADSLRVPYAAIELRLGDGWDPAAARGDAPPRDVVTFPLISQRETVGRLLVGTRGAGEQLSPDDERLLADLARQAGPATHAVALRRALDASRAGLVTAREEERRRLRRDLHDGLGPTLAGLTLGLDTARALAHGQRDLDELLSRLKAETQRAVTDVRRIVYGLRPPALDQLGLTGSLREEVSRLRSQSPALRVSLDTPADGLADLPAAVEVACYRIVAEALTNVASHANARTCSVRVALNHCLEVDVRDDGEGLPEGWRAGVGIASMRERVAELGGELMIEPSRPHGTSITARLPARGRG